MVFMLYKFKIYLISYFDKIFCYLRLQYKLSSMAYLLSLHHTRHRLDSGCYQYTFYTNIYQSFHTLKGQSILHYLWYIWYKVYKYYHMSLKLFIPDRPINNFCWKTDYNSLQYYYFGDLLKYKIIWTNSILK